MENKNIFIYILNSSTRNKRLNLFVANIIKLYLKIKIKDIKYAIVHALKNKH